MDLFLTISRHWFNGDSDINEFVITGKAVKIEILSGNIVYDDGTIRIAADATSNLELLLALNLNKLCLETIVWIVGDELVEWKYFDLEIACFDK